jgi:hypothetical protein
MEIDFFMHRKWKLPIWILFVIPICTHVHNVGSFEQTIPWFGSWPSSSGLKAMNFVHDRSFLRRGFYNICNSKSLLFFLITRSHNMTQCKGFTFFDFFWISYARFKIRSKRRAWTFLARGLILQNYLWISNKTSTCEPENDFLKNLWAIYDAALVQIFSTSSWIKTLKA